MSTRSRSPRSSTPSPPFQVRAMPSSIRSSPRSTAAAAMASEILAGVSATTRAISLSPARSPSAMAATDASTSTFAAETAGTTASRPLPSTVIPASRAGRLTSAARVSTSAAIGRRSTRRVDVAGSTLSSGRRFSGGMCQTNSTAERVNEASTASLAIDKCGEREATVMSAGSSCVTRGTGSLPNAAMRAARLDWVAP